MQARRVILTGRKSRPKPRHRRGAIMHERMRIVLAPSMTIPGSRCCTESVIAPLSHVGSRRFRHLDVSTSRVKRLHALSGKGCFAKPAHGERTPSRRTRRWHVTRAGSLVLPWTQIRQNSPPESALVRAIPILQHIPGGSLHRHGYLQHLPAAFCWQRQMRSTFKSLDGTAS